MKLVQNSETGRVIDLLRPKLAEGCQLDMVTSSFSLFAFSGILQKMAKVFKCRLLLPQVSPRNCQYLVLKPIELCVTACKTDGLQASGSQSSQVPIMVVTVGTISPPHQAINRLSPCRKNGSISSGNRKYPTLLLILSLLFPGTFQR